MTELQLITGYQENAVLRKSFNNLAQTVFGINFEDWYQKGYWTNKYIPFSFVENHTVVANVSVNIVDLLIDGAIKHAIQIGTVMTHPNYRHTGLSKRLLLKVLETYEHNTDLMYLFANQTVLDFYPKFGFNPVDETQYILNYSHSENISSSEIKKLSGVSNGDLQFIYEFSKSRIPVSKKFSTLNTEELLQFYCLYVFPNDVYYLHEEDVIVIYQFSDDHSLQIFDIIAQKEFSIEKILPKIVRKQTKRVIFHFNVDNDGELDIQSQPFKEDGVLFVRRKGELNLPKYFKHPITSQA
ncbi:GNAT family N-acetyltransferase [Litchfieldia alkalitelluris]|uniref:GNAT family N-acetyltransferase n=1 Tax=Litchfieldia alkalitelluris TaxID=304268 RepID=UPI000997926B|nr:GNAT family N-acetyltransferase [Litchfieldia alkalitelluris]